MKRKVCNCDISGSYNTCSMTTNGLDVSGILKVLNMLEKLEFYLA